MSIVAQTTLAHDVSYNGIGLHAANEVHMVLRPAPADTGIVFRSCYGERGLQLANANPLPPREQQARMTHCQRY